MSSNESTNRDPLEALLTAPSTESRAAVPTPAPAAPAVPRSPQHIRSDLHLTLGDRQIDLSRVDISGFGIAKLPFPDQGKTDLGELPAGQKGVVRFVLTGPAGTSASPITFTIPGRITRERTAAESCHGFAFDWYGQETTHLALLKALTEWGFAAEPNRRKHERTKVSSSHPVMPTVAQIRLSNGSAFEAVSPGDSRFWTARIHNMSPGGLLLSTENNEAALVKPSDALIIVIQPRDGQGFTIEALGDVRRVLEHVERINGNEVLVRSLGIRFEWLDEDQRTLYFSLLKCLS